MYLSRLFIQNYRSINQIDLKFEQGKNVIVGRNNSGKSNILKAIDLVLGEYSPTYYKSENITLNDFHCGSDDKPIFIWCEIDRCNDERGNLEKILFDEVSKSAFFRIYKDKTIREEIRIAIKDFSDATKNKIFEFNSDEGQARIDSNEFTKKWIGGKPYCKLTFEDEFRDKSKFAIAFSCFKNEDGKFRKELVLLYRENYDAEWIQGINCSIRNILIQSAIIPAFRDPKDQLRISAYSWFGKLLKEYIKTDGSKLTDAFAAVKVASEDLFKTLRDKVSEKEIDIAFPNTTISFQFNPETKQDIHKSTLIYVNDGFNSELKDKGAGIQSAVTIGLYDFYVRNVAHSGSSLLAVEEPELYLHPHGRRIISDRLTRFIAGGKNQVILTTHTSEFLSSIHETQNIISVKKDGAATHATNIYFDTAKRKQILIKKHNAELFFADAVILTEGADKYIIEEVARLFGKNNKVISSEGEIIELGENWLNNFNISIINCAGKDELWKYAEILLEIKIPFVTSADFDFLRSGLNGYFTNLKFNKQWVDHLNALKSSISRINPGKYKTLNELGDVNIIQDTQDYLKQLLEANIYIFSGELENFYKIQPKFDKEAGVIEILGQQIAETKQIDEYIEVHEFNRLFEHFLKIIGYEIYNEPEFDQFADI